jgi:HEAT repeat protein
MPGQTRGETRSDTHHLDRERVHALLSKFKDPDGLVRQEARSSLVAMGPAVTPYLVKSLADPSHRVRWESAKALSELHDPAAAEALVDALDDDTFGVRWLAAEGLIELNEQGLKPLLSALAEHSESVWLRDGAHHILRTLANHGLHDQLAPVIEALEGIEPSIDAAVAAKRALKAV